MTWASHDRIRRQGGAVALVALVPLTVPAAAGAASTPAPTPVKCTPATTSTSASGTPGDTGDAFIRDRRGRFTRIAAPGKVKETVLYDIDNRGRMIGGYTRADGKGQGFLLRDGRFTKIDAPPAMPNATVPLGINERGQITGAYSTVSNTTPLRPPLHGFLLDRGRYTTIDVPKASSTTPFGISDRGRVVGLYMDAGNKPHGFLLDRGRYTTIDVAGATGTGATGINNRGQIVGVYTDAGNKPHGFLLDRGRCTTLDVKGAPGTQTNDIDNRGRIVGIYSDSKQIVHGFLRDADGRITTIDAPGAASATAAFGNNDRGQIVGFRERTGG
jgi:probable HAF family extracellular repeat protein